MSRFEHHAARRRSKGTRVYSLTSRERTFTLIGIMIGLFLGALDQTIVGTAMPKILQDLNGLNLYSWVVTAYLLMSTSMIPIYGKLSDLYGRKVIILVGIGVFLLGSGLSGQSRSMTELIVFRGIQGLGSAALFSSAFTVIADLFPPAERGKYQGLFGAVFGISSIIGPWLGGLLTDNLSWRWVFYVNIPIGIAAALLIILEMPRLRHDSKAKVSIDWAGAAALLVGIVPLLLALSLGGVELPWASWQILGLFALGAAGIAVFILIETRASEPIIPFDLFRNRTYVVASASSLLIAGIAFFGAVIFLPIFMVVVVGVSSSQAGLTVTPLTLGVVVGSFVSGQLVSRLKRYKALVLIGIFLTFIGYALMQLIRVDTTQTQMTLHMIILGLGIGPALPIFPLAIQNSVKPHELGTATSSSQFFRQIGSTIGVAVFGTILTTVLTARLPTHLPAELRGMGAETAQFSTAQLQSGNIAAVGDQIKAQENAEYSTIERALVQRDPAAIRSLNDNPAIPAQVKDLLGGGMEKQVGAALEAEYAAVVKAASDPGARAQVLSDPRISDQVKAMTAALPSGANPAAQKAALGRIRAALDASRPALAAQVTDTTLAGIRKSMDEKAAALTQEVTVALKTSFTEAVKTVYFWGLFVVGLGFIVALFLPELTLRGKADMQEGGTGQVNGQGRDGHKGAPRPEPIATDKEP